VENKKKEFVRNFQLREAEKMRSDDCDPKKQERERMTSLSIFLLYNILPHKKVFVWPTSVPASPYTEGRKGEKISQRRRLGHAVLSYANERLIPK
jgi:hypothetical protein